MSLFYQRVGDGIIAEGNIADDEIEEVFGKDGIFKRLLMKFSVWVEQFCDAGGNAIGFNCYILVVLPKLGGHGADEVPGAGGRVEYAK